MKRCMKHSGCRNYWGYRGNGNGYGYGRGYAGYATVAKK